MVPFRSASACSVNTALRVIVDCVGPLSHIKGENKFLFTIVHGNISSKQCRCGKLHLHYIFYSVFGVPKMVQTHQDTNFMSQVFTGDEATFCVSHCSSSGYHPECQDTLDCFYATLKTLLCENGIDWVERVHLLRFSAREMVQESLGSRPTDLVQGPQSLLYDKWLSDHKPQKLCDFVSTLRFRLHLSVSQSKPVYRLV